MTIVTTACRGAGNALLCIFGALLVACGGGGGGDDGDTRSPDDPPIGGIFVREPTHDGSGVVRTFAASIAFEGDGFISPGNVDCEQVFPVNLALSWRNDATGQSGSGISGSACVETFLGTFANSRWSIREGTIDLAIGTNRITITVADNRGNTSSATVTVERLRDTSPPFITSRSPGPDATEVPVNRTLSVRFSEAMERASLTQDRFVLTDSSSTDVVGFLSYDEANFNWRFTPEFDLQFSSTYTVTISGAVEDFFGGNAMGTDQVWTFTTAPNPDVTPPQVTRVSPEPATECVAPDAVVVAGFDEPLDSTTIGEATFLLAETGGSAVSGVVDYDGEIARLVPDLPLLPGTGYEATLTTAIADLAGNRLAAPFEWSFGTAADGSTGSWNQTSTLNAPSERRSHTAVWTGSEMIVFGGYAWEQSIGSFVDTDTGGRYDPVANSWAPTSTDGVSQFDGHTAVWTGTEMIIWGGGTTSGARYDPAADSWQPTSATNAPTARSRHAAVWTGGEMIVWGGLSTSGIPVDTGSRYDPATDTWQPMSIDGAPSPRVQMAVAWTGSELVIWGGVSSPSGGTILADGARYDPVSDSWSPLPSGGASGGFRVAALWTGSEVIVWDGGSGTFIGSDGFAIHEPTLRAYDPMANAWRATASDCEPYLGASGFHAHWTGDRMFVWAVDSSWGGYFYDPSTDGWQAVTTTAGPKVRSESASVWAGDRFVLWGGQEVIGGLRDDGFVFTESSVGTGSP